MSSEDLETQGRVRDAGLLAYRQLDEALDLTALARSVLCDFRTGKNTRHSLPALLS